MREPRPTAGHDHLHLNPMPSAGGSWVCRPEYETGDGFLHLTVGHWADHGDCAGDSEESAEEDLGQDPRPWSFHIHLGVLAADDDRPSHWEHGQRYCASARSAPLAICLAALRAFAGPRA